MQAKGQTLESQSEALFYPRVKGHSKWHSKTVPGSRKVLLSNYNNGEAATLSQTSSEKNIYWSKIEQDEGKTSYVHFYI